MGQGPRSAAWGAACCLLAASLAAGQPANLDRGTKKGWNQLLSGEVDSAIRTLENECDRRHPSPHAYGGLGLGYLLRGDSTRAHEAFCTATALGIEQPEGPLYAGLANFTWNYAASGEAFERACRAAAEWPQDPFGTGRLARSLLSARLLERGRADDVLALAHNSGFITDWLLALPFANEEERGFDLPGPPEQEADFAAVYLGKHQQEIRWSPLPYPPPDGMIRLDDLADPAEQSVAYALTFLYAPGTRQVTFAIGHAGAAKVWINRALVYANPNYHPCVPDQWIFGAQLASGFNAVLVKVCCKRGPWAFCLRQLDGKPLEVTVDRDRVERGPRVPAPPSPELAQPIRAVAPALAYYEALTDHTPADGWANLALSFLALIYQNLDEHDTSAYEQANVAVRVFPKSSLGHRLAAIHAPQANARLAAGRAAITVDPQDLGAYVAFLTDFAGREDFRAVLPELNRLSARGPLPARLRYVEGLLEKRQGLAPKALGAFREAEQAFPLWLDPVRSVLELDGVLVLAREERNRLWRKAVELSWTTPDVVSGYVCFLLESGEIEAASSAVATHWNVRPGSVAPAVRLGQALYAAGRLSAAQELLRAAQAHAPWRADVLRERGLVELAAGNMDAARSAWEHALALAGSDPLASAYLERTAQQAGRFYDAYWTEPPEIALPQVVPATANAVVLLDQQVTRVDAAGTSTDLIHTITHVLTDSGAQKNRKQSIWYDPERETIRIVRARAVRKDGTVFEAGRPASRSTLDPASRIYGDYRVMEVSFEGVEPGGTVDFAYERTARGGNLYADYYGAIFYCGGQDPVVRSDLVIQAPASRPLFHVVAGGLKDTLSRRPLDGGAMIEYRWRYEDLPMVPFEPQMPPASEVFPYVKVSTFRAWEDMTAWWWSLARDQFRFDPQVQETLRSVLVLYIRRYKDPQYDTATPYERVRAYPLSPLEQLAAINQYVNTDVRYLGLEFGVHGYKPHATNRVCAAAYGDCKDKAVLGVTLLGALGIPAGVALVRTSDRGEIDYTLPSLNLFNHAIYYVPDVEGKPYWIDGTASYHGPSELPWDDQGVNALVVFPDGSHRFLRTPLSTAEDHGATYTNRITLDATGRATITRRSEYRGLYNPTVRAVYYNAEKRKESIEEQWGRVFPGARATRIETSDLENFAADQWMECDLWAPTFAEVEGDRMRIPITFFPINASRDYAALGQREWDLLRDSPRYPWHRKSTCTLILPPTVSVEHMPEVVEERTPFGSLSFSITQEGNMLQWRHNVVMAATRVKVADYPAFRRFCASIDRLDIRRIVLRKTQP